MLYAKDEKNNINNSLFRSIIVIGLFCVIVFFNVQICQCASSKITLDVLKKLALSQSDEFEYDIYKKVTDAYIEIYVLEQKIEILKERYERQKKNGNSLMKQTVTGKLSLDDKKKAEDALGESKKELARLERSYNKYLKQMKDMTGIDLSFGYDLTSPLVKVEMNQEVLSGLIRFGERRIDDSVLVDNKKEQIEELYETFIDDRNAYNKSQKDLKEQRDIFEQAKNQKVSGKIGNDVYEERRFELENEKLNNLVCFGNLCKDIYDLDYISGGGLLDVEEGIVNGTLKDIQVTYFMNVIASQQIFEFGVSVPTEETSKITDYELWVDGYLVGDRKSVKENISDLYIKVQNYKKAYVRFYHDDNFVSDSRVDLSQSYGEATVSILQKIEEEENTVASYTIENDTVTGMCNLRIEPVAGYGIAYYLLKLPDGECLVSSRKRPIREAFHYLAMARNNLRELKVIFYDNDETEIFEGSFDTKNHKILKEE